MPFPRRALSFCQRTWMCLSKHLPNMEKKLCITLRCRIQLYLPVYWGAILAWPKMSCLNLDYLTVCPCLQLYTWNEEVQTIWKSFLDNLIYVRVHINFQEIPTLWKFYLKNLLNRCTFHWNFYSGVTAWWLLGHCQQQTTSFKKVPLPAVYIEHG